jgi:hypothetical protein
MPNRYYKKYLIEKDSSGNEYYRTPEWNKVNFDDIEAREIIWQQGDRLDIIAEQLYGDPNLYKLLALFNGIGFALNIKPGRRIYLPVRIKDLLDRI